MPMPTPHLFVDLSEPGNGDREIPGIFLLRTTSMKYIPSLCDEIRPPRYSLRKIIPKHSSRDDAKNARYAWEVYLRKSMRRG